MTRHYSVAYSIPAKTGLARDAIVNTWSVVGPDAPTDTQYTTLVDAIHGFYATAAAGAAGRVADYFGGSLKTGGTAPFVDVKVYRRPTATGPTGSPVKELQRELDVSPVSASDLPLEVACCLSFHSDLTGVPEESGATRPRARLRGRVYLGPLNLGALTQDTTTHRPIVSVGFRADILLAAQAMKTAMGADWGWEVFSRTAWFGSLVNAAYVDDEFDTQRRRQHASLGRSIATIS